MNPLLLQNPQTGRVVHVPAGYVAFVPAPLPPEIAYDADLALALPRVEAVLSEVEEVSGRAGVSDPSRVQFSRPLSIRQLEMGVSSVVEATRALRM